MAVNYDVWGAPQEWNDSTDFPYADIKTAKTDCNTFKKNYENGNIPYNNIDLSLAFWGIGKNAFFAQPKYLSPYTDNGITGVKVDPVHEPVNVPCMFTTTRTDNAIQAYNQRYKPNVATISGNTGAYNSAMICAFNYQKIMLVPYVLYKKPNDDYIASWDLKSYIEEDMALGYSQIVNIGYKMWTGDGVNSNRYSATECGFAPVFTHDVDNYDVRYNNKIFYARGGYSQLTRGASRSNNRGTLLAPYYSAYDRITKNNTVDMTTALAYRYTVAEDANPNEIWYYFDDSPLWQVNGDSATAGYWCTFPYIHCDSTNVDTVKEYILKQLAFLGLPFCYDPALALRGQIGDTGIYLPKFDNKGITTGEYEEGAAALSLPNSQWTDGHESGYDPNAGDDDDGDTGNLNNFPYNLNRYANPNSVYALDESNFIKFVGDINNLYLTDADDTRLKLDFKGSNPNDYIIGVYGVPFLCSYIVPSGGDQPINIGPVTLPTAQGKKVDISASLIRDCGTVTIPAKGNFLDYEPYTQIELYIPMCGTIQLDCAQVVGRTLHVIVWYDITTMACVGCVYRDAPTGETLIHTINGTIGASLPLTSSRMGDYQNSVQTTKNALKQNEMRTALGLGGAAIGIAGAALAPETGGLSLALAGAAIGGLATAAGGAMTEKQLQYDLTHKQPALSQCSAADGMTAQLVSDLRPWIFIKRAEKLASYDAEIYGKTVGFACCINSTVGAFSGFTVYSNVDLSGIPATKTEIDIIKSKLSGGVYI